MTEDQITPDAVNIPIVAPAEPRLKPKRDLIRFNGEKPTAINLEHVTHICIEGNKITFSFYSNAVFVEFADDAAAISLFEEILKKWSAYVVE